VAQITISGRTAGAIAESVERAVHAGRAAGSEPLPTVRDLAATLKVSPATVAAAYKLLRARGLVVGSGRQGTRVVSRPETPAVPVAPDLPLGTIDLATGNPDPGLLPPLGPALRSLDDEALLYGAETRLAALVAFATSDFEADGIHARSIAIVGGELDAIERVLREHAKPGDRVAVEDPVFPGAVDLLRASGLVPVSFAVDDDGPVPAAFEGALAARTAAVIVSPRAQNPTGAAIADARAAELRRILRKFPAAVLIENDSAAPIAGAPPVTLRERSRAAWAIVRSTSKFLGPDLRLAVMAADDLTSARVQGRQALGARWVSRILQRLALSLWSDPSSGRRLARAADVYAQRRSALLAALSSGRVRAHGRSGLNVWIPVRDEGRTVRGLAARGWAVAPGERFRIATPPAIRVTTAALTQPDTERFAADLTEVLAAGSPRSA
jgi:DNA-binding transcriptional MocR family regulator